MFYLYLYKNLVNNMVYIGQTKDIKIRDQRHCTDSKMQIDQAIKKFGRENFLLNIIMSSQNQKVIALAEIEWIAQARNKLGNDMVYNISNGGPIVWLGMQHSKLSREKMSQSHKGLHEGDKNNMFGKQHSLQSKISISKNRKGKTAGENHPNSKLTKEEVELIKADNRSERSLAKIFKVSRSTINSIKRGINWR